MKTIQELFEEKRQAGSVNLNLGSNDVAIKGMINVDMYPYENVDIVCDLEVFPWPFPDNSVDLLVASQLVEHINPHRGGFIKFMNEAWRVLKPGGQFMIATPYGNSPGYIQDPTHCNPCNEMTFCYFDPIDPYTHGALYQNYRPLPWKVVTDSWYTNGNIEVLMEKRPDDPSYHSNRVIL